MSSGGAKIAQSILKGFGLPSDGIVRIGEGAFGEVFRTQSKPFYVLKLFKKPGMAEKEAESLRVLKLLPTARVPEVYRVSTDPDAIVMSYLPGVPMDRIRLGKKARRRAAAELSVALSGLLTGEGAFFEPGGERFSAWEDFYRNKAAALLEKARKAHASGNLSSRTLRVMERAYGAFDAIFAGVRVRRAFVHGDLNPQNVMLSPDGTLSGIFDPIGSFYGDSEYELFQLETNGGRRYPVLKYYQKRAPLSPRYRLKRDFYRLFAEVGYYFDVNRSESTTVRRWARLLDRSLHRFEKPARKAETLGSFGV